MKAKAKFITWQSLYTDEWFGRLLAANGKIICDGGEGYRRRQDARNLRRYLNPETVDLTDAPPGR